MNYHTFQHLYSSSVVNKTSPSRLCKTQETMFCLDRNVRLVSLWLLFSRWWKKLFLSAFVSVKHLVFSSSLFLSWLVSCLKWRHISKDFANEINSSILKDALEIRVYFFYLRQGSLVAFPRKDGETCFRKQVIANFQSEGQQDTQGPQKGKFAPFCSQGKRGASQKRS